MSRSTREESADLRGQLAVSRGDLRLSECRRQDGWNCVNGDLFYQAGKSPKLTINSSRSSINLRDMPENR